MYLSVKFFALICLSVIESPVGPLLCGVVHEGLCLLEFYDQPIRQDRSLEQLATLLNQGYQLKEHQWHEVVSKQLEEYFTHQRNAFDIPLVYPGTVFQRRVWEYLLKIPAGVTKSYLEQSIALGDKKAIRAVAHANGSNRISIVIPCHRVIGSDKNLTGYGGGLERKKQLLQHELYWATGTLF